MNERPIVTWDLTLCSCMPLCMGVYRSLVVSLQIITDNQYYDGLIRYHADMIAVRQKG